MFAFSTPITSLGRPRVKANSLCAQRRYGGRVLHSRVHAAARRELWLMKIGIFYATTTGNTTDVAQTIKEKLGNEADDPKEITEISPADLTQYDTIVVGAPTWNTGADDQRSGTEIDDFIYDLDDVNLAGRSVAVFGLGDAVGYGEYFCDAIGEIHDQFACTGARMIGYVDPGYVEFDESKSVRDGKFVGLAVDVVNEDGDDVEKWVGNWCAQVLKESKVPV